MLENYPKWKKQRLLFVFVLFLITIFLLVNVLNDGYFTYEGKIREVTNTVGPFLASVVSLFIATSLFIGKSKSLFVRFLGSGLVSFLLHIVSFTLIIWIVSVMTNLSFRDFSGDLRWLYELILLFITAISTALISANGSDK